MHGATLLGALLLLVLEACGHGHAVPMSAADLCGTAVKARARARLAGVDAGARRHRMEGRGGASWRSSVCGPRQAADAHGEAAWHRLRGGAGSLEDVLDDLSMDRDGAEASGGGEMPAEIAIDDIDEEDSASDSVDGTEGPRAKRSSVERKREKRMFDQIVQKVQMNSTYLSDLEKEAAMMRKTREHEAEMLAKEEREMRESDDTDELVKEAELLARDLDGNPNLEGVGDPADDEEPWDEAERDEETLRLLSSWAKIRNETDVCANISRELRLLREELAAHELKNLAEGVGLEAHVGQLVEDDVGAEDYKLAYADMLQRIFGPGVRAEGWLQPSRFGMQGLEYAVDAELRAAATDRVLRANVLVRAAATVGNATAIRRLCQQAGASPGAKDEWLGNVTALHRAASNGHTRAVRELIRLGADVDEVDSTWGRSALHMAARGGHVSTVKALAAAGADVNLTCRRFMTPLDHTVAVLLRRQLQPSSPARADTGLEPDDADRTGSVSSSDSESESLESFLAGMGGGEPQDTEGREMQDAEGEGRKDSSVDARRRRKAEANDQLKAEEDLFEVFDHLDLMASEEVVQEGNETTPAKRVPRDLLTVETVRLRRQMLDAEKCQGEAGRAAAEPNIANLEDIVRFLQVEMNAKGSTLAADYEPFSLEMTGWDRTGGTDASDWGQGTPDQSKVVEGWEKRVLRGVKSAGIGVQGGKGGLDAMLRQALDVAGVGRRVFGTGGAVSNYQRQGEDEYEEMQRLHNRAEAAMNSIFKERY